MLNYRYAFSPPYLLLFPPFLVVSASLPPSQLAFRSSNFTPTYANLLYQVLMVTLNKHLITHTFPPTLHLSHL